MRSYDREIRLLELLPGEGDDAIRCTTRVVSLNDHPDFETVSYVWGDRTGDELIYVSGDSIPVTKNLYDGLLRLRLSTTIRTLWIDQICINQWDLKEKAAQVALMRDIYRQCTGCVTWMGELSRDGIEVPVRDAEAVFDFLSKVATAATVPLTSLPVLFQDSEEGLAARVAFGHFSIYCDYTIAMPQLFAQVTCDLIRHESSLRPLLGACEMPNFVGDVPSWAINFAHCNHIGKRQLKWWGHSHRYKEFSACGNRVLETGASPGDYILSLKGTYLDEVQDTIGLLRVDAQDPVEVEDLHEPLAAIFRLLEDYRYSAQPRTSYKDGFSWHSALCRTLVGDLIMDEIPIGRIESYGRSTLEAKFEDLFYETHINLGERIDFDYKTFSDTDSVQSRRGRGLFKDLLESLIGMMENQNFFITKTGYIGIGPPQTKSGDKVWIFSGGNVPFVMRSTDEDNEACPQMRLVGDAYVHGVMDGEAMADEPNIQTVHIH
ncbi:heterokaryon incompatibility protein-domain-containing protein [Paraphoma chrysanthemicola]|uniref:Heterokaryon incompatibility protein-domain-containing protein n=1 Tax=Paraphoma chrysanthemicola TaxID=798071 RepID=A0A8K0RD65_9PLEO|nr:heterokaryon incompatibility protein-domain-containing protein [Paraphoma chrysanthemicola]